MTAKQFTTRFGVAPILDDLIRATCRLVGTPGHHSCGICRKHKKPRFMCGCLTFKEKKSI